MKVLLVVTKGDIGGAQKRMLDLAKSYQQSGVEVEVGVGSAGDWLSVELESAGIIHHRFTNLSRSNPLKIILWWYDLWRFLNNNEFDIIHLNSSSALSGALPAKLSRSQPKVVFTFRGLSIISPNYPAILPLRWFYWLAFRMFLPFVDVGVFQCENDRDIAHSRKLKPRKSVVIRPGINPDSVGYLEASEARRKLSEITGRNLEGKKIVGTIGRLSKEKNPSFLIDAFAKVSKGESDIVLVIIGDGSLREELKEKVNNLGLRNSVLFTGSVPGAARILHGFDLFVLPSLYEGVSVTLTEAVHAGVPIIASNVGGNRETLCNNENSLFSLSSEQEFVVKMRSILTNSQTREKIIASRNCRETLLLSKSTKTYMELYDKLAVK